MNWPLWKQVVWDDGRENRFHGELLLLQMSGESVYRNITQGRNPFAVDGRVLYPFGMSYAVNDLAPINGLYFLLLRPFLSIYQSISLIAGVSILVAQILMYLLLEKLSVPWFVAAGLAMGYGFTPYLASRMGSQLTYDSIFVFPLLAIIGYEVWRSKRRGRRILFSLLLGIAGAVAVLSNLNYTIMIALSGALYLTYFLAFRRNKIWMLLRRGAELAIAVICFAVVLSPWIFAVMRLSDSHGIPKGSSAGTIEFSGNLLGFFIPSQWNPVYKPLIDLIYRYHPYLVTQMEGFVYPGLVIVIAICAWVAEKIRGRINKFANAEAHVFVFFTAALLALGPYLHIGSHWQFDVAGRVFSIPLPFMLLQKLPLLQNFRAPGRIMLVAIFSGTVAAGLILKRVSSGISRKKVLFATILSAVILLDHSFVHTPAPKNSVPSVIYDEIRKNSKGSVLEIPYTVRDGLEYLGALDAIFPQMGVLVHGRPVLAAHTGRVNDYVFDYYRNDPLLGFFSQLVDENRDHAKAYDPKGYARGQAYNAKEMKQSADFLGIDRIVVRKDKSYSLLVREITGEIGFREVMEEGQFVSYGRELEAAEEKKDCVFFDGMEDRRSIVSGWSGEENGGRWIVGRRARMLLHTKENSSRIIVSARAIIPLEISLAGADSSTNQVTLGTDMSTVELELSAGMRGGLQFLTLESNRSKRPSEVDATSSDNREISVWVEKICVD